jgi:hypothetical protein
MSVKKSQVSIEFLLLIGFVFIFSLGFIVAAGIQLKEFTENKRVSTINDFGNSLKKEMDMASIVKEGYERKLFLPDEIDETIPYEIQNKNNTLIVAADNFEFSSIIPKTVGNLTKGWNLITKLNNTIFIYNITNE